MKKIIILFVILIIPFALTAGAFSDISDSQTAVCTESLSFLGVVSGYPDGTYRPDRELTRAEFSTMIVKAMNAGDLVSRYKNFTIYTDVPYTHWGAPYINVAAAAKGIVNGFPDGTFRPDERVTGAQAVTMVLRVLGYSVEDIGALWPQDYINMADTIGLTDGMAFDSESPLSRGTAAVLIRNMLVTDTKSGALFAKTVYSQTAEDIVLSTGATNGKLSSGEILTNSSGETKIVCKNEFPAMLVGQKGILISDLNETCIGFVPYNYLLRSVTVSKTTSSSILTTGGSTISVTPQTPVIINNAKYDYSSCWFSIQAGTQLIIAQNRSGGIETISFTPSSYGAKTGPFVITLDYREGLNPLGTFFSNTGGKIYKNGAAADMTDIRKYDVVIYHPASDTFELSDYKITGQYADAYPTPSAPTQIELFGHTFQVLPSAAGDFSSLKLGSIITLFLTPDNMVAGAVSGTTLMAPQYAIVTGSSGNTVTFDMVGSTLSLSGTVTGDYSYFVSDLVKVYTSESGKVIISTVENRAGFGSFDVDRGIINEKQIAPNAVVFEKAGLHGAIERLDIGDLERKVIPSKDILFVENDYKGRPYIIILNNVTGDVYHYGYISSSGEYLTVKNKDGTKSYVSKVGPVSSSLTLGGVSADLNNNVWDIISLQIAGTVEKGAFSFDEEVRVGDKTVKIADTVSVYSSLSQTFLDLGKALSFYDKFEIYLDKSIEDGGKVRFIVAK